MKKGIVFCLLAALSLSAQPRVAEAASGLHLPSSMATLTDGTVLVLQEDGKIFQVSLTPAQSVLWAQVWPEGLSESVQRTASGLVVLPSSQEKTLIAVYMTLVNSENEQSVSQVQVYERVAEENEQASLLKRGVLIDRIPGGNTSLGGAMAVSSDGFLYVGTGTAGNHDAAQDRAGLAGKILKAPLANLEASPWAPQEPQIFAMGLHSPAGLAFHPSARWLFAADRGPRAPLGRNWDEVNYIQEGGNYGWPLAFGGRAAPGTAAPVIHSTSVKLWDPGAAVFVPAGPWAGSFVWTGMDSRALFRITVDARDPTKIMFFEELFVRRYGRLRAMTVLPDGRLLIGTANSTPEAPAADKVYLITPR